MSALWLVLLLLLPCAAAENFLRSGSNSNKQWWPCSSSPSQDALPRRAHSVAVTQFGAIGDGQFLNTRAFHKAVSYLSSLADQGGGQLYVPPGNWLTGTFRLASHLTLYLEDGAVILGSQDPLDYPVIPALPSYGRGRELPGGRHSSLILAESVTDVVITGEIDPVLLMSTGVSSGANGTIDGQGSIWWDSFLNKTLDFTRGHLIETINSTNVVVSNLTLKNSPFWTLHPVYCSNVLVRGLTILAPAYSPNVDGIDPDSSTDVCIEDCYISVGDDLISIKSGWDEYGIRYGLPSKRIHIRRVIGQTPTSAGLALGSEMSGGVAEVVVESLDVSHSRSGLRLKTGPGRGGYVANISVSDLRLHNVSVAFDLVGSYGGHPDTGYDPRAYPSVRGVSVSAVRGTLVDWAGSVQGHPAFPFHDLCFSNVTIQTMLGGWNCSSCDGSSRAVDPRPCSQLTGSALGLCYRPESLSSGTNPLTRV